MKILYNIKTEAVSKYPRADDAPVAGLDPDYVALEVASEPVPEYDPATHHIVSAPEREGDTWMTRHTIVANPAPEPIPREEMTITPRQLRLWLLGRGLLGAVDQVIASLPEPQASAVRVEWEYSTVFQRTHPMLDAVGAALGLKPEDLDEAFLASVNV